MQKSIVLIVICLIVLIPGQALLGSDKDTKSLTGNVNLFLGEKFLEKDNWEPLEKQFEGGILIDVKHNRFPIGIALDLLYSRDEEDIATFDLGIGTYYTNVESRIMEFNLGLRKIWEAPKNLQPFIGGGLAIIKGNLESEALGVSVSDDETGFGLWADIGIYIILAKRFNLGIDVRWSRAEIDLFDIEARVGGWHFGAITGFHW